MIPDVVKIAIPSVLAFIVGILGTPILTRWLYANQMWKKQSVKKAFDGSEATISQGIHNDEVRKVPRMGGIVVWGSVFIVTLIIAGVSYILPTDAALKLNFMSRNQTWLPLGVLIVASLIGLFDDYLDCRDRGTYIGGGMSLRHRLLSVLLISVIGAWWFFVKLGVASIMIPFLGELYLGYIFVPAFILFMLGMYSGGIIDGIDGLAGGIFSIMFASYALIAFYNNQIDLAAFCMTVTGGLLAFLWYNIPPARFFLSETGTMGLTTTLTVVAFLTKAVAVLPIIALPLIATTLSSVIQILSKKYRGGKKIFSVAPLHNHFQAIGWPSYKVTMRYWIISIICAIIGVIITLIG